MLLTISPRLGGDVAPSPQLRAQAHIQLKNEALSRLKEPGLTIALNRTPDTQKHFLQESNLCRGTIALAPTSIGVRAKALHKHKLYIGPIM
jgi:hypothetical protein